MNHKLQSEKANCAEFESVGETAEGIYSALLYLQGEAARYGFVGLAVAISRAAREAHGQGIELLE